MDEEQIVVGIDGSASSWRALWWAAQHAEITGRALLVAYLGEGAEHLGNYGFGDDLGQAIVVALTRDHAALLTHTTVIDGDPAEFLPHVATGAAMLVLGREDGEPSPVSLGPFLAEILARGVCPTVVFGAPAAGGPRPGTRIVLGVSGSASGRAAMRFACAEGMHTDQPVLAVRSSRNQSWKLAAVSATPPSAATWDRQEQGLLDGYLDAARGEFPGVVISGVLTTEATRFALARESRDASLLVLGGRATNDPRHPGPGPNTLLAVYSLTCAVAVVPPPSRADSGECAASSQRGDEARTVSR